MFKFDRTKFWDEYRYQFGHNPIDNFEVQGTESLLTSIEADSQITRLSWAAFILGTVRGECGAEMQPIKEKEDKSRGYVWQSWQVHYWSTGFFGRGYSQLTWQYNYNKFSQLLYGDDRLVQNPDLVMQPQVGYLILATGCVRGMFTGHKLSDYLTTSSNDFINARRIVNGISGRAYQAAIQDAEYDKKYLSCLAASLIPSSSAIQ